MQPLRRFSLTGLALLLGAPLAAAGQNDSGTLEVLVEGGLQGTAAPRPPPSRGARFRTW